MTPEQTDEVVTAIAQALAGDEELTLDELEPLVLDAVGPWAADQVMPAFGGFWPRWRQAIPAAAHRGVLCFGAGRGRTVTYSRPSTLVPGFRPGGAAESLRELVRRYLGRLRSGDTGAVRAVAGGTHSLGRKAFDHCPRS